MLFPIERLLSGREGPLCAHEGQTLREVMALMVENQYSQLPVIDAYGELIGLVSDEVILHRYYHLGGGVPMLELTVDHCLNPAATITKEREIFEALDLLKNTYAIVIVEENKPVGILTEYDMAHFFRDLTQDLMIVEDIETSLRQIVTTTIHDEAKLKLVLINAFGEDPGNPGEPKRGFDQLTFGNLMNLIVHPKNWQHFEVTLQPQSMFTIMMEEVRKIRNQLAHFRGEVDPIQHDALINAKHWLASRPRLKKVKVSQIHDKDVQQVISTRSTASQSKYDPLRAYLEQKKKQGLATLNLEYKDIEKLLGVDLPDSARVHRAWWANDYTSHVHARAWLSAGWVVDSVDMNAEQVTFRTSIRALYPLFFDDLLTRLKRARPGITRATKASMDNWLNITSGTAGFVYVWVLPREPVLRVELYIDFQERDKTKAAFDQLMTYKTEIEQKIGQPLNWDRIETARACRVSISTPFAFTDSESEQEAAKEWGVGMLLCFYDTFREYIGKIA